jgi:hypothetical protein
VAHDHASLQGAVDRPATRILVTGEIDEDVFVHASDVDVRIAATGRIARLVVDPGVARVRVAGGRIGSVELRPPARWAEDGTPSYDESLMIEDVTLEDLIVEATDSAFVIRGRRVAILRNEVHAVRYSLWAGDTGPLDGSDLLVRGNRMRSDGPEATMRIHDVARSEVLDNVLENGAKHNYRVHGRSDEARAARNVLVRTGIMLGNQPGDDVGTVVLEDNVLHHEVPSLLEIDFDHVRVFVCRRNTVYTDHWPSMYPYDRLGAGWIVEGNLREPFRAYEPAPGLPGPQAGALR